MLQNTFQAALKMVSHAAGKKDVRYYLNGVHLEFSSRGMSLIATDGYRLAFAAIEGNFEPGEITISHDAIKQILAVPKSGDDVAVVISEDTGSFFIGNQTLQFSDVGGKYPDWRRVVTAQPEPTTCIGVNAEYAASAMSALSKLANRKYHGVKIHLRGANNSLKFEAGLADDFPGLSEAYCIVMPMRL